MLAGGSVISRAKLSLYKPKGGVSLGKQLRNPFLCPQQAELRDSKDDPFSVLETICP